MEKCQKYIITRLREIRTDCVIQYRTGIYEWLFIATAKILQRKVNNTLCTQELKKRSACYRNKIQKMISKKL